MNSGKEMSAIQKSGLKRRIIYPKNTKIVLKNRWVKYELILGIGSCFYAQPHAEEVCR